jgi:putative DNA primase/helicase
VNPLDEELELDPDELEPGDQPYTDLGNARRLVAAHGNDLRHNPQTAAWLAWDGCRWAPDATGEARRRAKAVVDAMVTQLATCPAGRRKRLFAHWTRSQAAARIEAMIHLAATEPGIPVLVADLDADPWALNTRSGVVDLRTGDLTRHDRRSLVTKLAPIDIDPRAGCPAWLHFLKWAMCGDEALVEFLQRAVGYSLTGLTVEQCMIFSHGHGENGKSTFHTVLQALLGDYAIAAAPDLLLTTAHEQHPTGTADLVGRRLVVVQEADEGRRLAEGTLKQLTGGDRIKARRMRQDFFEFDPTHKIWMGANHKPQVRGTDHAIWRRIYLVPWEARVDPVERDKHYAARLLAELPGILNWAIVGCEAWQKIGLAPPPAVAGATAAYRVEQDHVGRFLEDCCILGPGWAVTAAKLREHYERWCAENGERPWSARAMAPQLVERDCERTKHSHTRRSMWTGLTIADSPDAADWLGKPVAEADEEGF